MPKKTPYDFYQYWRNVDDADVIRCLKMLTILPLDEIARYEALEGSELNEAKKVLAYEVTKLVHVKIPQMKSAGGAGDFRQRAEQ
jgi:tyrosyl-tRNA synthetase